MFVFLRQRAKGICILEIQIAIRAGQRFPFFFLQRGAEIKPDLWNNDNHLTLIGSKYLIKKNIHFSSLLMFPFQPVERGRGTSCPLESWLLSDGIWWSPNYKWPWKPRVSKASNTKPQEGEWAPYTIYTMYVNQFIIFCMCGKLTFISN